MIEKAYPEKRKINIGSGKILLDGWFNFDCQVFERDEKRTDKPLGKAEDLDKIFPENWFEEVLCIHTIEHFYAEIALDVIDNIYFIMKPGGVLTMEAPDVLGCFRRYKDPFHTIRHLYAPPEPRQRWGEHWTHKSGWTVSIAANRLKRIGFLIKEASNEGCLYHRSNNRGIRDFHVMAIKPKAKDRVTLGLYEKKIFSQNGEDGIIQYLFKQVGTKSKRFVEIGCGRGLQNCTTNLSANHKWGGILFNNTSLTKKAEKKLKTLKKVRFYQNQVSPKNVNNLLKKRLSSLDVDLLSIDIDGLDYWVWKAISVIKPRVVVIEYNASFVFNPITVPCIDPFFHTKQHGSGFYHGASLTALVKLGREKGYSLAGCDSTGVNAFFVRDDLKNKIRVLTPRQAYYWPAHRFGSPAEHMRELRKMKFVKV